MGLKIVRRLLITLAILGGLFAGLNVVGERFAEDRLADVVAARFDLEQPPAVDLDVFPIVMAIIRGRLPGLRVTATDVRVEDLSVERLDVVLRDVGVEGGLLGGGDLAVVVGEGSVEVRVAQAAINAYLKERGEDARVRLSSGTVRVSVTRTFLGQTRRYEATGRLRLSKQRLIFEPGRVTVDGRPAQGPEADLAREQATLDVRIPRLPGGFRPTEVEPAEGALVLRATLEDRKLSLSAEE